MHEWINLESALNEDADLGNIDAAEFLAKGTVECLGQVVSDLLLYERQRCGARVKWTLRDNAYLDSTVMPFA